MSLGDRLHQRWFLDGREVHDQTELEVRVGDGTWRLVRLEQRQVKVEGWFPATMWVARGLLDETDEDVPISTDVEFRWPPSDRMIPETPDLEDILGRLGKSFAHSGADDSSDDDSDDDGLDDDDFESDDSSEDWDCEDPQRIIP